MATLGEDLPERMSSPRLTPQQRDELFKPLFEIVKGELDRLSDGDLKVLWSLRRKLAKELMYLERGRPMDRRKLKNQKFADQKGLCGICGKPLPERGAELDRFDAFLGYTTENTRLVHHECHVEDQKSKNYA